MLMSLAKGLAYERKGRFFLTDNAITVLSPPRFPVQFITRWLFTDAEKLIQSFDFTVCQAAIWAEDRSVEAFGEEPKSKTIFRSAISEDFYHDLAARRLVYTHPLRDEDAGGSMLRVIKFIRKGYNIQALSLAGVMSRIMVAVNTDRIEHTVGNGSKEKGVALVITSLLREVDPLTVIDGVDFVNEHEIPGDK